ncbi:MAG: HAMP domain-containing sensor histidine kinase [Alcaligenaceae bacterium]
MDRIWHSVAFRLALLCGGLVVASVLVLSSVFYFVSLGLLARNIDSKIVSITEKLSEDAESNGLFVVAQRIESTLSDGVDSDVEILLLTNALGQKLAGNIAGWAEQSTPLDQTIDRVVQRGDRFVPSRIRLHKMSNGALLVVGRDMQDLSEIGSLIARAVVIGGVSAMLLAILATLVFRHQLERRIWAIRHTTQEIEAGNLDRRIVLSGTPDEFDRLSADINRMLDRIQHLMEGVRHVSNTIAHNLRTPLGLIRGHLEEALRGVPDQRKLEEAGHFAIGAIDDLIVVLEKLLQIAEAESGARRQPFEPVLLRTVVTDLLELYDAAAEALGVTLIVDIEGEPTLPGDKDLLAGILANLIDNALKYAGSPAEVTILVRETAEAVSIVVQDNGPGIAAHERGKVVQRFYRLSSNRPGSGLGLSIVSAFTQLHDGTLFIEDAKPGLKVRIELPKLLSPTL